VVQTRQILSHTQNNFKTYYSNFTPPNFSSREQAILLRLEGYSYNEIHKFLDIPKSTLSGWLSKLVLSESAKKRLENREVEAGKKALIKRNKEQTVKARKRAVDIKKAASWEVGELSEGSLLLIGAVLYWAEGYKRLKMRDGKEITSHVISLTNSDPKIISTFILFLKRILNVPEEKITIEMRLFEHINAEEAINYWMNITQLPRQQFRKPMYPKSKASQGIRPKNRLPYGTIQVIVADTKLFYRLMGYIDGIKEKLEMFDFFAEVAQLVERSPESSGLYAVRRIE
jgi:hypothetical protein